MVVHREHGLQHKLQQRRVHNESIVIDNSVDSVWIIHSIALQCIICGVEGVMRAKAEKQVQSGYVRKR